VRRPGKTRPFRGPDGRILPDSIAEVGYRRVGGIEQWVMIRGESTENPPLILLHGGPGMSETGFFRRYLPPLERSFTLVFWDQRGAGKSFDRGIPPESMTTEQFVADLDDLVEHVRERLGSERVAIFGHSWGSVLGVLYATRFPDKVAAYVGSGQIGDWAAAESSSYEYALAEAERTESRGAVKKLREIGPPPYAPDAVFTERTCLARLEGRMAPRSLLKTGRDVLGCKECSVLDLWGSMRGFRFSMNQMWSEVSYLNLIELAPALNMPVFFLLGRNDHWVPAETSVAYFEALTAPAKRLAWFERSGHEPFVDEPAKFNAEMAERVRCALLPPASSDLSS
jgi:pimeloyl-ACP methyl ester carboxylesterase